MLVLRFVKIKILRLVVVVQENKTSNRGFLGTAECLDSESLDYEKEKNPDLRQLSLKNKIYI